MSAPCCNWRASKPDAVRGVDGELQGVLDGDDPLVVGDEGNERFEQRRLAAHGAAAHEDIAAGVQHPLGFVTDVCGQRALCDQLRRRKGSCAEALYGNGHARPVAQPGVEDRPRETRWATSRRTRH